MATVTRNEAAYAARLGMSESQVRTLGREPFYCIDCGAVIRGMLAELGSTRCSDCRANHPMHA